MARYWVFLLRNVLPVHLVAQALLGFRRRGDLHLPAKSVRRRLKLAASYRTADCSRGPKGPGQFRCDGNARTAIKTVCRGGLYATHDSTAASPIHVLWHSNERATIYVPQLPKITCVFGSYAASLCVLDPKIHSPGLRASSFPLDWGQSRPSASKSKALNPACTKC